MTSSPTGKEQTTETHTEGRSGRRGRMWRALAQPFVDTGRYKAPRYLRVFDFFAKLLALPWLLLLCWALYAAVVQLLEPIPDVEQADRRRAYFYAIGLTLTALGALIGAPLVLVRTFISDRQAQAAEEQRRIEQEEREIAEQTHFTTLYSRAIEQLGANATVRVNGQTKSVPAIEVRIGAIYALERIAMQSDADYRPIIETLCAYVRQNSGPAIEIEGPVVPELEPLESSEAQAERLDAIEWHASALATRGGEIRREVSAKRHDRYANRPDIRAALDVLMRRPRHRRQLEAYNWEEPPSLLDSEGLTDMGTTSASGESFSADEVYKRLMQGLREGHLQLIEERCKNVAEFKERLRSWKLSAGEDAWSLDLGGAILQGMNRERVDFRRMSLQRARMEGAWVMSAEMQGADLEEVRMDGAFLPGVDLRGANLQRSRLDGADLMGAVMDGADLGGAQMRGSDLSVAWLGGADLDGARAEGANFEWAHMEGAYLGGAKLERANLVGADLEGAEMGKTEAQRWLMHGAFAGVAHLTPVEVTEDARLTRAVGLRAMGAADLKEARLEAADLRAARMDEANLREADMTRASLKSADLSQVKGLVQEQLDVAFGDGSVLLPDGVDRPGHWRHESLNDNAYYGRFRSWIESQSRPWPHAPVYKHWSDVEPIPFERPAEPSEIA